MIRSATELRTIWYMGAKTRLCDEFLNGAVRDLIDPGATILDACTGTAAVSRWFAPDYRILANDVQLFSVIVARAHLEGGNGWQQALEYLDPEEDLGPVRDANLRMLEELAPEALQLEASLLQQIGGQGGTKQLQPPIFDQYRDLVAQAPVPDSPQLQAEQLQEEHGTLHQPLTAQIPELLKARRADPAGGPAVLCTIYWAHVYFGLRQAMQIDSLRRAIQEIPVTDRFQKSKQNLYLAALIHAVSVCTSGTSHFAQPRSIEKDAELIAVVRRRLLDIDEQFEIALDAIRTEWGSSYRHPDNRVFHGDVHQLLEKGSRLDQEQVDLVYLDPPYTADNYSRFYHVLETLVCYDYPELERRGDMLTKGRYPLQESRFRSDFCRANRVEDAFRRIVQSCHERGARLLISYSTDTGLLTRRWSQQGEQQPAMRLRDLARECYNNVEIREQKLMHSGQGDSNRAVSELLLLCED
ncbi:MAG: DNA adenine methylase [Planctomycetota bacterium]|nr:DNA adenine methylase [Planctomycetota bacterium]